MKTKMGRTKRWREVERIRQERIGEIVEYEDEKLLIIKSNTCKGCYFEKSGCVDIPCSVLDTIDEKSRQYEKLEND